jgi:hypothetical protein
MYGALTPFLIHHTPPHTMTIFSPTVEEQATTAELAEIRRQGAEERLVELQAMTAALTTRAARKEFWNQYGEEIVDLSAIESHKGTRWIHAFLP